VQEVFSLPEVDGRGMILAAGDKGSPFGDGRRSSSSISDEIHYPLMGVSVGCLRDLGSFFTFG